MQGILFELLAAEYWMLPESVFSLQIKLPALSSAGTAFVLTETSLN